MAKIHAMMDIGKRSMMNSQTALQTVAHNIANKSTEGYSRQRVDQVTNAPVLEGSLQIGMGARAAQVSRTTNPFIEKQISNATEKLGFAKSSSEMLGRMEQVFNEQQNKALNTFMSEFFNSFRELSNNPESATIRTIVRESAQAMTKDFARVDQALETIQKDAEFQIQTQVQQINQMTKEIAGLNQKITEVELQGAAANDQRDRRDLLVKKMSEIIDVKVADGPNGMIALSVAGNALLVSGTDHQELSTRYSGDNGALEIVAEISHGNPANVITDRIKGGSMGGLIGARDSLIVETRQHMNELAYGIAQEVNQAHRMGFDRRNQQGGDFFENVDGVAGAASQIKLSREIFNDVNRIAAASRANAPGDNNVANVIANIQYATIFKDGTASLDDAYNSVVGEMGVRAADANHIQETQGNLLQQMQTLRESVSGVSLDEEATKMIEFQKTFDASARLIRTADEMFETILSLKRM